MPNTTALRLLLLSADPFLVSTFVKASAQFGIEVESSKDRQQVSDQLNRSRYEAVVLDFDTVPDARPMLASVRESRFNNNAVAFVVVTDQARAGQVLLDRAQFLLRRPIETSSVKKALNAAYELVRGERRRHFRCAVDFPVKLTIIDAGNVIECVAMNVSSRGVAVATPTPLKPGETVDIALYLPHESVVHAIGFVIWDDQYGKSGKAACISNAVALKCGIGWIHGWIHSSPRKMLNCEMANYAGSGKGKSSLVGPRRQI